MSAVAVKSAPVSRIIVLQEEAPNTDLKSRGELGHALFRAGFRDQHKAGLLIESIWAFAPEEGIKLRDFGDRVEIELGYLRTKSEAADNGMHFRNNYVMADTVMAMFIKKLQLLAPPFTLEVAESALEKRSLIRLVIIKQSVLTMLPENRVKVTRRPNDWRQVKEDLAAQAEHVFGPQGSEAYSMDLSIASEVFAAKRPRLNYIGIEGLWDYHHACLGMRTDTLRTTRLFRGFKTYMPAVHQRYRMIVRHDQLGNSEVHLLRKTQVD